MPTRAEQSDLKRYIGHVDATINSIEGWKFVGLLSPYYVFLPLAGWRINGSESFVGDSPCYWSSSYEGGGYAYFFGINSGMSDYVSYDRDVAMSVRACITPSMSS